MSQACAKAKAVLLQVAVPFAHVACPWATNWMQSNAKMAEHPAVSQQLQRAKGERRLQALTPTTNEHLPWPDTIAAAHSE